MTPNPPPDDQRITPNAPPPPPAFPTDEAPVRRPRVADYRKPFLATTGGILLLVLLACGGVLTLTVVTCSLVFSGSAGTTIITMPAPTPAAPQ